MQPSIAQTKDSNQNPKKWHSKALDAVVNFIVGQTDSESDASQNESDSENESSGFQSVAIKEDVEKLKQQNAELTKSLTALLEENEANYFKSREREKQLKQKYETTVEKLNQENLNSVHVAKELKRENEKLKAYLDDLLKELEICQGNLKSQEVIFAKLKAENQLLKANNSKSKEGEALQKLTELSPKYHALVNERSNLMAFFQQLSTSITNFEELESYKAKEYQRLQDTTILQTAIAAFEKKFKGIQLEVDNKNKKLAESLQNSESKFVQYQREAEDEIRKHIVEKTLLRQSINELIVEKASNQSIIDKLATESKNHQELLEKERSYIKTLLGENSGLKDSIGEFKKRIMELQAKIRKTEEDGFEIVD